LGREEKNRIGGDGNGREKRSVSQTKKGKFAPSADSWGGKGTGADPKKRGDWGVSETRRSMT